MLMRVEDIGSFARNTGLGQYSMEFSEDPIIVIIIAKGETTLL